MLSIFLSINFNLRVKGCRCQRLGIDFVLTCRLLCNFPKYIRSNLTLGLYIVRVVRHLYYVAFQSVSKITYTRFSTSFFRLFIYAVQCLRRVVVDCRKVLGVLT